jgi:hypothetical protein
MKPIFFSTPMVQAIRAGQKTMTRRVMNPQPTHHYDDNCVGGHWFNAGDNCWACSKCGGEIEPFTGNSRIHSRYLPGDILWVRETWCNMCEDCDECKPKRTGYLYKADGLRQRSCPYEITWRPSIFMPREACRIFLRVKSVRVERVQEISEEDAKAEGVKRSLYRWSQEFHWLWDSINAERGFGWDKNPWVWVIEFERCEKPEEER